MKRMRNLHTVGLSVTLICLATLLSQCAERETWINEPNIPSMKENSKITKQSKKEAYLAKKRANPKVKEKSEYVKDKVDELNPEAAKINARLGLGYLQKGDVQRAQMKLQQAYKQAPHDPDVTNGLAYYYAHTGQIEQAKKFYAETLKHHPNSGQAHNNYGVFLCQHDDQYGAIRHFMKATLDPQYLKAAEAFENAGLCALKINQTAKAWEYFQYARQRDPRRASVLMELARLAYAEHKFPQAKKYLEGYEQLAGPTPASNELNHLIAQRTQSQKTTG